MGAQHKTADGKQNKKESYVSADLEEFCLWLYGIYEETTIES